MESVCDRIQEWFDAHGNENHDFEEIPDGDRMNPDQHVCAILKIQSLIKNPSKMWLNMYADHDVIGLCSTSDFTEQVTDDDLLYLRRCGVCLDDEIGGMFLFA